MKNATAIDRPRLSEQDLRDIKAEALKRLRTLDAGPDVARDMREWEHNELGQRADERFTR